MGKLKAQLLEWEEEISNAVSTVYMTGDFNSPNTFVIAVNAELMKRKIPRNEWTNEILRDTLEALGV